MVWFSTKNKIQEQKSDLDFTPKFKITYPEGWHERQTMSVKDKCDHFNNWASKLQLWIQILKILQTMKMKIPNKRRDTDEGHLASLIRRKMITKVKSSKKDYNRKNKNWRGESPSLYLLYVH